MSLVDRTSVVWKRLMAEFRAKKGESVAASIHASGLETLNLPEETSPSVDEINEILKAHTRWQVYGTQGFADYDEFFGRIVHHEFPVNLHERTLEEFYHASQPDKFHDVYGHLPFLVNDQYSELTIGLGKIAMRYANDPIARECIQRYYFHLFEYGLIREADGVRVLGGAIVSSLTEAQVSTARLSTHFDHNPIVMMETPFVTDDTLKPQYFVIDGLGDVSAVEGLILDYVQFRTSTNSNLFAVSSHHE